MADVSHVQWKCAVEVPWFWPAPCPPNVSDLLLKIRNCSCLTAEGCRRPVCKLCVSIALMRDLATAEVLSTKTNKSLYRSDWDRRVASVCHVMPVAIVFNCDVYLNGSAVIRQSSTAGIRNIIWNLWFTLNGNKSVTFRSSSPAVIIKAKVSTAADPLQTFSPPNRHWQSRGLKLKFLSTLSVLIELHALCNRPLQSKPRWDRSLFLC